MLLPRNARQLFIQGPAGQLDCLELLPNTEDTSGIAIIFHPNPLDGGTNTNKIVQTLAKTLNNKGYLCYCPNLRGVGLSDGVHDFGNKEVDDGMAIHQYLREKYPNLPLILGGFSFGTKVASGLAYKVDYQKLILIGPAVTKYQITIENPAKTIVIHGDEDEIIAFSEVLNWSKVQNQPIITFPNTGHFFHSKLVQLQNILNNFCY